MRKWRKGVLRHNHKKKSKTPTKKERKTKKSNMACHSRGGRARRIRGCMVWGDHFNIDTSGKQGTHINRKAITIGHR